MSHKKAILGIILLVVLGMTCIAAGRWQLNRAGQREALKAAMAAGRQARPVALDAQHRDGPDWHPGTATGTWLNQFTVLLDNRNLKGRPGLWVATPLRLQGEQHTAILILRGWVKRPLPPETLPDLNAPEGLQRIRGTMLHHVPRLFDLGSLTGHSDSRLPAGFPNTDGPPPRLQNLDLDDLAQATGLELLPVILEQAPRPGSSLTQQWPGPSLKSSQNYNYALQWFSFAAIALIAAFITAWRAWYPRRNDRPAKDD